MSTTTFAGERQVRVNTAALRRQSRPGLFFRLLAIIYRSRQLKAFHEIERDPYLIARVRACRDKNSCHQ